MDVRPALFDGPLKALFQIAFQAGAREWNQEEETRDIREHAGSHEQSPRNEDPHAVDRHIPGSTPRTDLPSQAGKKRRQEPLTSNWRTCSGTNFQRVLKRSCLRINCSAPVCLNEA